MSDESLDPAAKEYIKKAIETLKDDLVGTSLEIETVIKTLLKESMKFSFTYSDEGLDAVSFIQEEASEIVTEWLINDATDQEREIYQLYQDSLKTNQDLH